MKNKNNNNIVQDECEAIKQDRIMNVFYLALSIAIFLILMYSIFFIK
jgi:hypothetical protein